MTQQQHPIAPPPELFAEWLAEAKRLHPGESTGFIAGEVARLAYQTGADTELEACCEWLQDPDLNVDTYKLRAARRPKPPSLKEMALQALAEADAGLTELEWPQRSNLIRHALEQLPDNE
jgi:hypothetical protein